MGVLGFEGMRINVLLLYVAEAKSRRKKFLTV